MFIFNKKWFLFKFFYRIKIIFFYFCWG